jgi:STE24 endopeptidase
LLDARVAAGVIGPMAQFDPQAATDAFLASLPTAKHLTAIHYTQGSHWLLLWGWLASVAAALVIARLRLLPRLRSLVERGRARPWLFSFLAAAVFAVADFLLELPWTSYAEWGRERGYGLTDQPYGGWLGDSALSTVFTALFGGVFFMALYGLMRRSPRRWWAWAGALAAAAFVVVIGLGPVFIEPLFNTYTPAPAGPTREAIIALARRGDVPSDRIYIYDGSRQSNRYTANVTGLFGSATVAISDTMAAKGADIAEVRAVVAHEMGHYRHGHIPLLVLFYSLLAMGGFGLGQLAFPIADRWMNTGAAGISDPVGLPTLAAVVATLGLLATPVINTVTRFIEADADAFSLGLAHEPSGLAKAMVKTIEYRADSPSGLEELLFYDHPSVRRRIQRAMDWKAGHLVEARAQETADAAASRSP